MNPVLPDNILRCMSPEDRKPLGKAGKTAAECAEKQEYEQEKELQSQIAQFLRLKGIPCIIPPFGKKSQLPEGWPDVSLAYMGVPLAIEAKSATGKLRPEQEEMHALLRAQGWIVHTVRSLEQVRSILKIIEEHHK